MFTVWSPFDGEPIPAPNETERDILLSQGYLTEPPEPALATGGLVDGSAIRLVGEHGPGLTDLPPGSTGSADPDEP